MHYKPVDEDSLRHLFSSEFAEKSIKVSYLGPVLNAGVIQNSPDCLVIDRRTIPFTIKRCEFKFEPTNINQFAYNGQFELAIIWGVGPGLTIPALQAGLLQQNGCNDIIALNQIIEFQNLPNYILPTPPDIQNLDDLNDILIQSRFETVYTAYCFARAYPDQLDLNKIKIHLRQNFHVFAQTALQGQHNAIICLKNRLNPIIELTHQHYYRWYNQRNVNLAIPIIENVIINNFHRALPNTVAIIPTLM